MKVLSVFGTRPEAIKMAPVIQQLRKYPEQVETKVCVTAQHRRMLDQVLQLFDIQPHHDLDIMEEDQSLTELTSHVLTRFETVLRREDPDWVLVQGDTTTAMAVAMVAFYHGRKIGHIEAGLRTGNKFHPFPEEINRKVIGGLADLHFAPTEKARQNLLREGVEDSRILVTGNTVIDAMQWVTALLTDPQAESLLQQLGLKDGNSRLLLVTAHRRENLGAPLENICTALFRIAEQYRGRVHIVYPVHLNPNVQEPVYRLLGRVPHVTLLEPLDYLPMVHLMKRSYLVLTDSGGIQEEAPALGKPVLVLREITERPEAVEVGMVKVVGTSAEAIFSETCRLLENPIEYEGMARAINLYGDGHAAERIVSALLDCK